MTFHFRPLAVPDVQLVEHDRFGDARGFFTETYRGADFAAHGVPPLVQDNHSRSRRGVLRGLHYQLRPQPLGKLVRCIRGRIFDVAVDIRRSSPTYGRWVGAELAAEDNLMIWVPEGFAHGFLALEDDTEIIYKQTGYWSAAHERSIRFDDPAIGIAWPDLPFVLSDKDRDAPLLADAENNLAYSA